MNKFTLENIVSWAVIGAAIIVILNVITYRAPKAAPGNEACHFAQCEIDKPCTVSQEQIKACLGYELKVR